MKITKYEHACFVVDNQGQKLVVDPGIYAKLTDLSNIVAVVVTHVHQDHFFIDHLRAIAQHNPAVVILAPKQVTDQLEELASRTVDNGSTETVGPFTLEFFGGQHAYIYDTNPQDQNVGVLINKTIYYPGDSFSSPKGSVAVLALPADAPWMKLSEAIDFLRNVKPKTAFPTHIQFVSEDGLGLIDRLLGGVAESSGITYKHLKPSDSIEV